MGQYLYPLDILMLDDEPASDGIHLTPDQRLEAFEELWRLLSADLKHQIHEHIENEFRRERNNEVNAT